MTTDRARRLDPEALKTFVEVARQGSFSAAAERLNKTPAAISYRIRALEENMGTPLFERTTRSVTLTPAGELLLERATQIFEWMQHLPEELQQVNDGVGPRFHLVINNLLFNAESVGGLLATLSRSFPHTSFRVRRAVYMGTGQGIHPACRLLGKLIHGLAAGIGEAQHAGGLVEALARRVVARRAEERKVRVVAHVDDERVPAGHAQRQKRRLKLWER